MGLWPDPVRFFLVLKMKTKKLENWEENREGDPEGFPKTRTIALSFDIHKCMCPVAGCPAISI